MRAGQFPLRIGLKRADDFPMAAPGELAGELDVPENPDITDGRGADEPFATIDLSRSASDRTLKLMNGPSVIR